MTRPHPTPITCAVFIAGELVADGADTTSTAPTALSGLEVTWGRATTVDQPDTSTAAFTLEDRSGDQAFARLAAIGRTVDIIATGTLYSGETVETVPDPTLTLPDGAPPPWILRATPQAARIVAGRLRLEPAGEQPAPVNSQVRILPAAPSDLDPAAWDAIPTAQPGQTWVASFDVVAAAPGAAMRVGIEWWDDAGHTRHGPQWLTSGLLPATVGPHSWQVTPPEAAAGKWLSLIIKTATGYAWDDLPPALTWDTVDPAWTWDTMAHLEVDNVHLAAPTNPQLRPVLVFTGRITDSVAAYDLTAGATLVDITAADTTAELANRDVGAEPWPAERLDVRAARIVAASGAATTLRIDPRVAGFTVGRMDVDRQQVMPLLTDLATSVDAVIWSAVHITTGHYLWLEDTTQRAAMLTLALVDGTVQIVPAPAANGITLSACDVDLEPVRWTQTNADIATRAVVTWQDQSTTPDITERTVQVAYTAAEAPAERYGVRRVSVASQVTSAADATTVANAVLARLFQSAAWRVGGLTYRVYPEADPTQTSVALTLLDGTTRIGCPVLLVDLPEWSPVNGAETSGYVEGGRYTYEAGAWVLSLVMSSAAGVGESIAWDDLDPAWTWDLFDPAISWDDLTGVGPPPTATTKD